MTPVLRVYLAYVLECTHHSEDVVMPREYPVNHSSELDMKSNLKKSTPTDIGNPQIILEWCNPPHHFVTP